MFMHDGKPRRKPLVYGKTNRSTSTYDIFDLDDTLGGDAQSHNSSREDETTMGQQQIHGQVVTSIEATPKGKLSIIRQRRTSTQTPRHSTSSTQEGSETKDSNNGGMSEFDLPLSDEEEDSTILFEKSMQKRRRLTPVRNPGDNGKCHQRGSSWSRSKEANNRCTQVTRPATTLQVSAKKQTKPRSRLVALDPPQRTRTPTPEDNLSSPVLRHSTPNPTRLLSGILDTPGSIVTPSKLALNSLSLTGRQRLNPEPVESSPRTCLTNHSQVRLSKPRRRLIDSMASPRKRLSVSASCESSSEDSASDAAGSMTGMDHRKFGIQPLIVSNASEANEKDEIGIVSSASSNSLNMGSKPRATYSKERSHLSDMMTEDMLDPVSHSASQEDGTLMSQNSAMFGSLGSAASQEVPEGDLEEEIAGIRSIHELRHSGGNARSQVDLESILEDIEAKGSSARARRLRGLTQLTEKLKNPEVAHRISQQSLDQRLGRLAHLNGDVIGQTLLAMILSHLMVSVQLPVISLKGIFEVLVGLGRVLLPEPRELASIVRDRKQNVSKATCKEIVALVEPFCSTPVWLDRPPKSLSPQLIFIRSLDIALRQARQLGDFGMVVPAPIFGQLVQFLLQTTPTQLTEANDNNPFLMMEFTVSIIESLTISKNWAGGGCLEIARNLSGLGPILEQLTVSSAQSLDQTRHLILRLILNITNNDPDLCDAFSEPALLSAIFGIVDRDFLEKPTLASAVMEASQLEGVILALGALSNLAEHSSLFRQAMLDQSLDGRSFLDRIALRFRNQVEEASEASSVEQTTSLVAFGYLAVLLCNICIDSQIRDRVRAQLEGGTLQTLLLFVREFLDHFRRAEELDSKPEDDGQRMKSGFVARFEGVLNSLRQAERNS